MESKIELQNKMSDIIEKMESLKMRIMFSINKDDIRQKEKEYEELLYLYYDAKLNVI